MIAAICLFLGGLRGFLVSQQKYRDLHTKFKAPTVSLS